MDLTLAIALPIADNHVYTQFMISMLTLSTPDYHLLVPKFPHIHLADIRNNLVEQAKEKECTHMIFLDTDQIYKQDTIQRLLMNRDKSVVGGVVHRRYPPYAPILYRGELGNYEYVSDDEMYSGELVEVDATGTACMMIDMDVFKHIKKPYFKQSKNNGKVVGEDIYFCSRVRNSGLKIFVDTSIQVEHISLLSVNRTVYELYKRCYNANI